MGLKISVTCGTGVNHQGLALGTGQVGVAQGRCVGYNTLAQVARCSLCEVCQECDSYYPLVGVSRPPTETAR